MSSALPPSDQRVTASPPPHLEAWTLPPGWAWGTDAIQREHRHYQEVMDALGRSLSLVSVPNAEHGEWLHNEARALAHRNHPSIPTTYHYWASYEQSRRGPGYLRRWISGETVHSRVARLGPDSIQFAFQVLREAGSTLAYLHDTAAAHGAVSASTVWLTPGGRLWLLGWEWVLPADQRPAGVLPDPNFTPWAPEWGEGQWKPTPLSDQWQLAAMLFLMLTGETPPERDVPPLSLLRSDCPQILWNVLERALAFDPADRYPSIATMLRELDRHVSVRPVLIAPEGDELPPALDSAESRLRWATADDYEILAPLGQGMFGSVWRARDLSLSREVAIKVLHPHIARDDVAVARFQREARLAAQLAHAAIVPIYDSDSRGGVVWYTMELAEGGSVANLVARSGKRPFDEIAPQVDEVLEALHAAHTSGIIHRDLKPENILIDRYRRWRIGDFGIAYALGDENAGTSGTPSFAAPEQLLGEAQGPATDCYALASIVYYVLTGRPPFGDGPAEQILARQLSDGIGEQLQADGFDDVVGAWLARGLAQRVEDRFDDAQEMRVAWREVVRQTRRGEDARPWWRRLFEGLQDETPAETAPDW
ncbi:protein kinase domain-containing protein [Gemmatimonas sp. UBA7669]|uniref:protein kinase domain-containing protein n=1 Tax=Gemmatimonas sp. UBA7669 TaxID=1946568 RepID=UPI0025C22F80|nr:serine/threonine-protein kinase [Gemmatimonas sp. UBA7669]